MNPARTALFLFLAALTSCHESSAVVDEQDAELPATITIEVDPHSTRSIAGETELDRKRYFAISDSGVRFENRVGSPERFDHLANHLEINFGRNLGPIKSLAGNAGLIREDSQRPGYADLDRLRAGLTKRDHEASARMKEAFGENLDVASHGHHKAFPPFMGQYQSDFLQNTSADDHHADQSIPLNTDAAAELSAAIFRYNYSDLTRPRYYEPVNEPHWSFLTEPDHIAQWHLDTLRHMHAETPGVLVGGPCNAVGYLYSGNYRSFKGLRNFIDATAGGMDFYSFHAYDYYHKQDDGAVGGAILSGLPLEGVLDLLPNYSSIAFDREIPIVVSEHGGYMPEKSAAARRMETLSPDSALPFEEEMKRRSTHGAIQIQSTIANTLAFMDHPHTVKKAVPFMLLETSAWDPRYYAALYAKKDFDPDSAELVPSSLHLFYELFRGVKGRRVSSHCPDPDIQLRSFVDGDTLILIAHNLADQPEVLEFSAPTPSATTIRRFGPSDDLTPFLSESTGTLDSIPLGGRETLVIFSRYPKAVEAHRTLEETIHYGDRVTVPVEDKAEITIDTPEPGSIDSAILRIGFNRPAEADTALAVTINGQAVEVPVEDSAPRYTHEKHGYSTTRLIKLDPDLLQAHNTITIAFPDSNPGSIGSAVIRAARPR